MIRKVLSIFCLLSVYFLRAAPAPDFSVTASDGKVHQLYADYVNQGKVLVIEMFFTTCPPCNAHAPSWQALYQKMQTTQPGKVEFLMLSTQNFDNNAAVAAYKTTKGLTMPGAGQDGGSLQALAPYSNNTFGVFQGTPTFIVITPYTGEVIYDVRGSSVQNTMNLLEETIAQLVVNECSLSNYNDDPITNVALSIDAPAFDTVIQTKAATTYTLQGIKGLSNSSYTINPSKADDAANGVTTFDLVLVARHILGLDTFLCSWQFIAADMNNTGSVSAADIVVGRKIILGIDTDFPGGSWRFLGDRNATNGECRDFKGIKVGDLSSFECNNFRPDGVEDRDAGALELRAEDAALTSGQTVRVALRAGRPALLSGLQLQLDFDPAALQLESVEAPALPGFDGDCYHLGSGAAKMLWYDAHPIDLAPEDDLFVLTFRALRSGRLSESLFFSKNGDLAVEALQAGVKVFQLESAWVQPFENHGLEIYPNPAQTHFTLSKRFDISKPVLLQLFDAQGRIVSETTLAANAGISRFRLEKPGGARGFYFLRLDGTFCGKIVFAQ